MATRCHQHPISMKGKSLERLDSPSASPDRISCPIAPVARCMRNTSGLQSIYINSRHLRGSWIVLSHWGRERLEGSRISTAKAESLSSCSSSQGAEETLFWEDTVTVSKKVVQMEENPKFSIISAMLSERRLHGVSHRREDQIDLSSPRFLERRWFFARVWTMYTSITQNETLAIVWQHM